MSLISQEENNTVHISITATVARYDK